MTTVLPFQYAIRGQSIEDEDRRAALIEQRDRDLEDFLSTVVPLAWLVPTMASGTVSMASTRPWRVRQAGGEVQMRGQVSNDTAGSLTAPFDVGTLPVGLRPSATVRSLAVSSVGIGEVQITSAGVLSWRGSNLPAAGTIDFDATRLFAL